MKIAFKGNKEKHKDIKDILHILGGVSRTPLKYDSEDCIYYISDNKLIEARLFNEAIDNYRIFTVDEFKTLYPYKPFDTTKHNKTITGMMWNGNEVLYTVAGSDEWISIDGIKYNKPNNKKIENKHMHSKISTININKLDFNEKVELNHDEYEITIIDGKTYLTLKEICKYPKTIEECFKVLNIEPKIITSDYYQGDTLNNLQKLLICRDAYYKCLNDYYPEWDKNVAKYCIIYISNEINVDFWSHRHAFLAFPTKEIAQLFLINFKNLIEECKLFL